MRNRSVVLTTHLLDEAEALCSRIAIMTLGQVKCLGSAQHLRSKFGEGYHIALNLKEFTSVAEKDAAVRSLFNPYLIPI